MKNNLFLFLLLVSFNSQSQKGKFGIRSIEQNNGVSTTFSNYYEFGLNLGLDITASYDHHLFELRFNIGGEFEFLSNAVNQYNNLNFMYGREFLVTNWLVIDGFAGVGYVNFNKENSDTNWIRQTNRNLNLPIILKFLFVNGKVFNMGLNTNINLNSFKVLYSTNLILQFKFR